MKKRLVAYFSAGGTTKKVAEMIANCAKADLIEITPKTPYTERDLNWMDKKSRSSIEMSDKTYRPELLDIDIDMNTYHEIILGFPIWWYVAPAIINTFVESYDFSGKTVVPFATSGGSGMGKTEETLRTLCPNAIWKKGEMLNHVSDTELKKWLDDIL